VAIAYVKLQIGAYMHCHNTNHRQWLKWFCEAGGSPDDARLEQTPYPFQPH